VRMTIHALHPGPDELLPPSPFTGAQAQDYGISRSRLRALVESRSVRRVLTGVYVGAEEPDSIRLRCEAARLVTAPHVVLCDRTAAWIWGVDTFEYRELEVLPPLETWALRGRGRVTRRGCAGGARDLSSDDIVEVEGLKVTTPLRTSLDLACRLSQRAGLATVDAFMRDHELTKDELQRGLLRFRGRRGVVQARALVAVADGRSESHGESWVRLAIIEAGLPVPELQWWVDVDGVPTYRLDLAYPKHKIAVEYDGLAFHTTPEQRRDDKERREWLEEYGWTVIVVKRWMLTNAAITEWTGRISVALDPR
jgi:Protein of unknown function (DUF559)